MCIYMYFFIGPGTLQRQRTWFNCRPRTLQRRPCCRTWTPPLRTPPPPAAPWSRPGSLWSNAEVTHGWIMTTPRRKSWCPTAREPCAQGSRVLGCPPSAPTRSSPRAAALQRRSCPVSLAARCFGRPAALQRWRRPPSAAAPRRPPAAAVRWRRRRPSAAVRGGPRRMPCWGRRRRGCSSLSPPVPFRLEVVMFGKLSTLPKRLSQTGYGVLW